MPLWHPVGESYNAGRPREKTGAGVRGVDLVQAWKDLPKEVTVHVRRATGAGAIPGKHGAHPGSRSRRRKWEMAWFARS